MTVVINLPMPPSTNRLWRSTRRGVIYKDVSARDWCESAAWTVAKQRKGVSFKGNVSVALEIEYRERGDADNKIKAVLDMLERGGLLENDRQVVSGFWTWSDDVTGVRVTVAETKSVFGKKAKIKRREFCPACGNALDPRGRPTCECDDAVALPQKVRVA